jgi:hypothetical protein
MDESSSAGRSIFDDADKPFHNGPSSRERGERSDHKDETIHGWLMRGQRSPSKCQSDPEANRCKHVDCYAQSDRFCYEGRTWDGCVRDRTWDGCVRDRTWDECVRDRTYASRHFRDVSVGQRAVNANPRNYSNTNCDADETAD